MGIGEVKKTVNIRMAFMSLKKELKKEKDAAKARILLLLFRKETP